MIRKILIAGASAALLGCFPAYGQEQDGMPELDGAPGSRDAVKPLNIPKPETPKAAVPKPVAPKVTAPKPAPQVAQKPAQSSAAADKLKADEARLAKLAEAQKAEQQRLAQAEADLRARQASLDAREAELAAEEKRLGRLREDQEAELAAQKADLATRQAALDADRSRQLAQRDEPVVETPEPPEGVANTRRPVRASFDIDAARQSCAVAGEEEALDQRYYSARYDGAPRLLDEGRFEDGWALRGLMRLETRRGYSLVDTICQVDADGEVQRFAFLR